MTAPIDAVPVTTPTLAAQSVGRGATLAASGLFTVSDAEHDPIAQYDFWDTGTGGAHFTVNGATAGNNQDVYVTAAQLAQTVYQSGPGTDTLYVRANDGFLWGPWTQGFTVTAPIPRTPVLSVEGDGDATSGETIPLSDLVMISDPDQAGFSKLELWDSAAIRAPGSSLSTARRRPADMRSTWRPPTSATPCSTWARWAAAISCGRSSSSTTARQRAGSHSPCPRRRGCRPFPCRRPQCRRGQSIALSTAVTIADPDGVGFRSWSCGIPRHAGRRAVRGERHRQTGGHEIDVAPANVASTVFDVGTLGGTDTLWAQLLQGNGQLTRWKSSP